jgi:hypothetical protein
MSAYIQASLVRNHNILHTAGLLLHQTCVWGLWHLDCQRNKIKIATVNFETELNTDIKQIGQTENADNQQHKGAGVCDDHTTVNLACACIHAHNLKLPSTVAIKIAFPG